MPSLTHFLSEDILPQKLQEYGPVYQLRHLTFPSFLTKRGALTLSASDVVQAVSALLESSRLSEIDLAGTPGAEQTDLRAVLHKARQTQFWVAYDALSPTDIKSVLDATRNVMGGSEVRPIPPCISTLPTFVQVTPETLLRNGIEESIKRQKAIVRQALTIIQKQVPFPSRPFVHPTRADPALFRKLFKPVPSAMSCSPTAPICAISSNHSPFPNWPTSSWTPSLCAAAHSPPPPPHLLLISFP